MKLRNFLFIFIIFMLGIVGITNVDAASKNFYIKGKYCSSYKYNYSLYKKYAFVSTKEVDSQHRFPIQYSTSPNQIVYCIEKGVPITGGTKKYSSIADVSTDSMYGNIAKAIAYGKNGTSSVSSCTDERIATSFLLHMIAKGYKEDGKLKWQTITNSEVRNVIEKGSKSSIASKFISIRNKVLDHYKMPFSGVANSTKSTAQSKAKFMKYSSTNKNFYASISDSILKDDWGWKVYSKDDGIDSATISGGKLSVTAGLDTKGKNLCVRIRKTVATGTLYRSTATGQDTALLLNEGSGYMYTYVCFKSSYISIKKVDAANTSKVLSGAKFKLYTDSKCSKTAISANDSTYGTTTSGSNGYGYFYNMKDGTYYAKETQSPAKYVIDKQPCRKVVVSGRTGSVTFENDKITSTSVQVFKNDKYLHEDNSEKVKMGEGIPGVNIGLYSDSTCKTKVKSTLVSTPVKTTDSSGMVIWDDIDTTGLTFPYDLYVMEEKSSIPSGYVQEKEDDCKKVQISSSDVTAGETTTEVMNSVTIYNIPFGKIKILKLDDDTRKPIEGITFKLLDKDKKEVTDKNGNKVGTVTTDKNGVATFKDIFYGVYYIEEIRSNENYKKEEPYLFELNANTDSIKLAKFAEIPYYIADVNMNNVVDNDDLVELTTMLKDETGLVGLEKKKTYSTDVDKDGVITEGDAVLLENYLTNKDAIVKQINAYDVLCKDQTDCKLPLDEFKAINKVYSMNDADSPNVCFASYALPSTVAENDDATSGDNQTPSGGTDDNTQTPSGGSGSGEGQTPSTTPSTCRFTDDSLVFLRFYITQNQTSELNANFNGDTAIDGKDADILEAYLSYVKNDQIDDVVNYVTSVEKIKEMDVPTMTIMKRIGTRDVIPSDEVHASIVVTNVPIDMKISKLDISNQEELPGAEIVIKDSKGEEFLRYVSTEEVKEFYIPAGEYTLIETIVPSGYDKVVTELKFKVRNDGNIELVDNKSELFELVNSSEERDTDLDHLRIYNSPIKKKKVKVPDTGSTIAFVSIIAGLGLVGTGGYFMYNRYRKNPAK